MVRRGRSIPAPTANTVHIGKIPVFLRVCVENKPEKQVSEPAETPVYDT